MEDKEKSYEKMVLNSLYRGFNVNIEYNIFDSLEELISERNMVNRNETIDKILDNE